MLTGVNWCQQVKKQVEEERERLIVEGKDPQSPLNLERNKTYDRLVMVQEDLLHHVRGMKVERECVYGSTAGPCCSI